VKILVLLKMMYCTFK